jgi:serine phosphatase RsbU (regulator of sigma subunit)
VPPCLAEELDCCAAQDPEFPVRELAIPTGERLLLYTDRLIEPQNAAREFFGDRKLEAVIRKNQSRLPAELLDQILGA